MLLLSKSILLSLHFIIAVNLFNVQAANKALATNKLWMEAGDKEDSTGVLREIVCIKKEWKQD